MVRLQHLVRQRRLTAKLAPAPPWTTHERATPDRTAPGRHSTKTERDAELGAREAKAIEQRASDSRLARPTLCELEKTALDRDTVVLSPQRGTFASLHNGSAFSGLRLLGTAADNASDSRDPTTNHIDRSVSKSAATAC